MFVKQTCIRIHYLSQAFHLHDSIIHACITSPSGESHIFTVDASAITKVESQLHHKEQLDAGSTIQGAVSNTEQKNASTDSSRSDNDVDQTLSLENTQDVYEAMYDVREKWYNIGGIFRVPESTLLSMAAGSESDELKLRRVIVGWLQRCGGTDNCSWHKVFKALMNKTVGREDLAHKVLEEHLPHYTSDEVLGKSVVIVCLLWYL